MARKPSMTTEQAEQLLGSHETIVVTSENRKLVCKWATSKGMVAKDVYKMSNYQLENLYKSKGLNEMETDPAKIFGGQPIAPVSSQVPANNDAANQLAQIIKSIAGGAMAPVDENRVNEIINNRMDEYETTVNECIGENNKIIENWIKDINERINNIEMPTLHMEIKTPEKTTIIEGLQHSATKDVIMVAALGHPVMLVGPAGCGKTTIGETVAKALNLDFYITSIVFDTHELMGFVDGYGKYHMTAFRKAFEFGGVWVADEIDAWDAAALLAANSALANGFATFPDSETPVKRHENFRMIATANTFGHGADRMYVGRNQLDAASLDRFATIDIDYDAALEKALSNNPKWYARVISVRKAVQEKSIRHIISTRAIIMGQLALAAGMSQEIVENLYLFKGMNKNDKKMIDNCISE